MPFLKSKFVSIASILALAVTPGIQAPVSSVESSANADRAAEAVLEATPHLNDPDIPDEVTQSYATVDESARENANNVFSSEGATITVPEDAMQGVALESKSKDDADLSISLPFADEDTERHLTSTGLVTYENSNDTFTVPLPYDDGSIQMNTVIESASAPKRFEYEVGLPDGVIMSHIEGGGVVLERGAETVATIAPAWARDANGNEVETWYEIEDSTLVQTVEHSDADAYPIVADPYLGINLFGHVYTDWYNGAMRVNANLSPYGWSQYVRPSGRVILNTYGYNEVLSRGADVRTAMNKLSMTQQFQCHALGALAAGQWGLEKFRPNRTVSWTYGVGVHHCNWTTANRY